MDAALQQPKWKEALTWETSVVDLCWLVAETYKVKYELHPMITVATNYPQDYVFVQSLIVITTITPIVVLGHLLREILTMILRLSDI